MVGTLAGMPDLVALDLPGGIGFVDALRRVWERGDAAMPVDQRLPAPAARAVAAALRPGAVIGPDGERRHLDGGQGVEPGDALVMATSGSTGQPKGVVLTHDAVAASAWSTNARLGVDPATDLWLACLPLAHVGGMAVVTRAILSGTALEVLPSFDAGTVTQAARRAARDGRRVLVSLVTAALRQIDPGLFEAILLGGAAPPGHLPEQVVVTYGMTETASGVVYDGVPLDGVAVRIEPVPTAMGAAGSEAQVAKDHRGAQDREGAQDQEDHRASQEQRASRDQQVMLGQILVRGPMLLRTYRDGQNPTRPDGWFPTGDMGHVDGAGRLHVVGRMGDVIVTGGEKVWPAQVEQILAGVAGVAEVAVAGCPDPHWGHRVVAYVVGNGEGAEPTLDQLRHAVKTALGPWAAPRQLVRLAELPRTSNGKVRRNALVHLVPGDQPP